MIFNNMQEFITNLPKAELHVHIKGSLSSQTILKIATRNKIDFLYKSVEEINNALAKRKQGLAAFLDHHYLVVSIIQTQADFYEITYELLRKCKENNIVYIEMFFDPQFHTTRGIPIETVINGIHQGRCDESETFGVEANLIMCINRERSVEIT